MIRVLLPQDERRQQNDRDDERTNHDRLRPASRRTLDDAVEQSDQTDHGEHRAEQIELCGVLVPRFGDDDEGRDHSDDDDRNVDEKDGSPPEVFEQVTTCEWSDRDAESRHAGPECDCSGTFGRIPEHVGEDRQRRRHDERRPEALQRAEPDQRGCSSRPANSPTNRRRRSADRSRSTSCDRVDHRCCPRSAGSWRTRSCTRRRSTAVRLRTHSARAPVSGARR